MIVARASRDPAFKARLLTDANAALRDLGLGVRNGMTLKVVEDTECLTHIVLPAKRAAAPPPGLVSP
jgi:hypothetical protein